MIIYLNADRTAIVPEGSADAAFGVQPKDMKRLGYDKLPVQGNIKLPELPEPETAEDFVLRSASLTEEPSTEPVTEPEEEDVAEEPEAKQAPKPANKAAKKPANK
jgi:hypothetical protein